MATQSNPSINTNEAVMEQKFSGLRRFNLGMGVLHLIQGILMIAISNDTTYPIYTNFLSFNTETFELSPNPQLLYELRFGPAVAACSLPSSSCSMRPA